MAELPIEDFDYFLPDELIAQIPLEQRDESRLLKVNQESGEISHHNFKDILDFLHEGDLLVFNNSKVFHSRINAHVVDRNLDPEVIFLRPVDEEKWEVLIRRMRKLRVGEILDFNGMTATLKSKDEKTGICEIEMDRSRQEVFRFLNDHGEIPLPPYIRKKQEAFKSSCDIIDSQTDILNGVKNLFDRYQTVYAKEVGSVAAPTAGLHFTDELLNQLKEKGVKIVFVTLHVGIGTFQPIWVEDLNEHEMHEEFVTIEKDVFNQIHEVKKARKRVIAVGTTSTRALEGVASMHDGKLPDKDFAGMVNIFLKPGSEFNIVDSLITNFHLPKTTLLVLISAFAGRELVMKAYAEAIKEKYRFYSFGDAMLIE